MSLVMVSFDLDGTLVNKAGEIHPADIEILSCYPAGVTWVANTGRPLASLRRKLASCGLLLDDPLPFPAILQNGTVVYHAGEKLGAYFPFSRTELLQLYALMERYPQISVVFNGLDQTHLFRPSEVGYQWTGGESSGVNILPALDPEGSYGKITCLTRDTELLAEFDRQVKRLPIESALCYTYSIEITAGGKNKAAGLQWLAGELGVPHENIFVAGDSYNDLPLFGNGWHSFAPATADAQVLSLADQVIDVQEEGLLTPILRQIGIM